MSAEAYFHIFLVAQSFWKNMKTPVENVILHNDSLLLKETVQEGKF